MRAGPQAQVHRAASTRPKLESECLLAMADQIHLISGPEKALPLLYGAGRILRARHQSNNSTMAMILLRVGQLMEARGDHAPSELSFEKALALAETALRPADPRTAGVFQALTGSLYRRGDYEGAAKSMRRALESYRRVPTSLRDAKQTKELHEQNGRLQNKLGRHEEAMESFRLALRAGE